MRLRPIDVRYKCRTIADAGGEDRALLRSNPSARAGAGTRAGVCLHGSPPPSPTRSGHKAINLGVRGRAPRQTSRTGGTYVSIARLDAVGLFRRSLFGVGVSFPGALAGAITGDYHGWAGYFAWHVSTNASNAFTSFRRAVSSLRMWPAAQSAALSAIQRPARVCPRPRRDR